MIEGQKNNLLMNSNLHVVHNKYQGHGEGRMEGMTLKPQGGWELTG
jgi:hypothetical protein